MRLVLAALVGVAFTLSALAVVEEDSGSASPRPPQVTRADPGYQDVEWFDIRQADDADKPGDRHSALGHRAFTMSDFTCGRSGDELRFRFDAPAQVIGVDLSVDLGGSMELVEVMVAAHGETGYHEEDRSTDPLLHAGYVQGDGSPNIEETVMLPYGVDLAAGDHITVGAWLCSTGVDQEVHPEVIVFYRWLG